MFSPWLVAATLISASPVDFDTEILPVVTRAGCNAGACHGAAAGRGGFKLSLFAGNPAADHLAIVHEWEGRRVNLASPDDSLILAKPAGYKDHEGGVLFDVESEETSLIRRWIAEGAKRHSLRKLERLEVTPSLVKLDAVDREIQVQVNAHFDDGSVRDVTRWSVFSSADPDAVVVEKSGKLRVTRRGQHVVIVRYLSQILTVQMSVPLGDHRPDASPPAVNWIDDEINTVLAAMRLPASPRATDTALLRRLKLDLTGRLPTPAEIENYVSEKRSDKYERLVEQLLSSDDFADYWSYRLSRWLRMPAYAAGGEEDGAEAYFAWLRRRVAEDAGWNVMARELVTSTGDSHLVGAANFHRQAGDPRGEAELVAEMFLGVELRCANCHNHPLDQWTQDDYHGLAAIFARLDRSRLVTVRSHGDVTHPATGNPAIPRLPAETYLASQGDHRETFARWLTDKENPFFAAAFVNRVWRELMGRGLVEPVDGLRPTNPATHPKLLDRLAEDYARNGFRLRHVVRTVVLSEAYRRASATTPGNEDDVLFYSHALIRPLPTEVYVDAVADVLQVSERGRNDQPQLRSVQYVQAVSKVAGVAALSGCSDPRRCQPSETVRDDLATRLQLINGEYLNEKIRDPHTCLATMRTEGLVSREIVRRLYVRALGREPNDLERQFWMEKFLRSEAEDEEELEDFCWSLLNCREFTTNH